MYVSSNKKGSQSDAGECTRGQNVDKHGAGEVATTGR